MANRYWVGGTANWDSTAGTKWATTSGGGGGASAPTNADDVFFDGSSGSGTVTVATGNTCRSADFTGFTGTLAINTTLNIGGSTAPTTSHLVLGSGMTLTGTGAILFQSTAASLKTVVSNGKTVPGSFTIASGALVQLADALVVTNIITLSQGTFDTNSQSVSASSFSSSNSSTRTLTTGNSSITLTSNGSAWSCSTTTNFTVTANTATVTISGTGASFLGGGKDWNGLSLIFTGSGATSLVTAGTTGVLKHLTRTGTSGKFDELVISASFTCTGTITINGNSVVNRVLLRSSVVGSSRTITAAVVSMSNVDIQDVTGAGAGSWNLSAITGLSGDCGGNSGITFTSPATQTHTASAGGSWSDATKWTSRVPLPQDDVIVDGTTTGTLTSDMPRLGKSLTFTGFAGTLTQSTASTFYGSLILGSGMTVTSSGLNFVARGRTSHSITSNGVSLPGSGAAFIVAGPGGTYTHTDSALWGTTISVDAGTWDTDSQQIRVWAVSTSGSLTRQIVLGTSTVLLRSTSGNIWSVGGVTLSAESSTITVDVASASARTFAGAGNIYGSLVYTIAASAGVLTISGNNNFGTMSVGGGRTLRLTAGSTQNVETCDFQTGSGNVLTIDTSAAGSPAYLARTMTDATGKKVYFVADARTAESAAGLGYLTLDGTGDYAWTPDHADLDITGDLDLRVRALLVDWTPGTTTPGLIAKWPGSSERSYRMVISASGELMLELSSTGANALNATSSVALGITDNTISNLRSTWRASDGQTVLATAAGATADPVAADFSQVGTTRTISAGSIYSGTGILVLGAIDTGGTNLLNGHMYRAKVKSGLDGTTVFDADFTATPPNVGLDYLSVKDIKATGHGVWYAGSHSTNVSGNSYWSFTDAPTPSSILYVKSGGSFVAAIGVKAKASGAFGDAVQKTRASGVWVG